MSIKVYIKTPTQVETEVAIGIIKNPLFDNYKQLDEFVFEIKKLLKKGSWELQDITEIFSKRRIFNKYHLCKDCIPN